MIEETLTQRGRTLVRRLVLEPGKATPCHVDPYHRLTTIVRAEALAIEYLGEELDDLRLLLAGQTAMRQPIEYRAVNVGVEIYKEVTIFFLDRPNAIPQLIAN